MGGAEVHGRSSASAGRSITAGTLAPEGGHRHVVGRRAVLARMADDEIVSGWRVRSILAQDGVPLQPFDQDVWAGAFGYERVDVHEALATFSATRGAALAARARGAGAPDPSWRPRGAGVETIAHLTRLYAGHDLITSPRSSGSWRLPGSCSGARLWARNAARDDATER